MSSWTRERLERLIADGVEESVTLEYKRAGSLANTDSNKVEITKDVSAFANSAGGTLIYGIAEPDDKKQRHRPQRLDPVSRSLASKEWLEQIIQTIQPRIDGVVIHPVPIDEAANTVCYVVEVPQSHTAHQARDHVYYKRQNFNRPPMEDYEVRDVMNRRSQPRIRAFVRIDNINGARLFPGIIKLRLENFGRALVRDYMADLQFPTQIKGFVAFDAPNGPPENGPEGAFWPVRLSPKLPTQPLFPTASVVLSQAFRPDVGFYPVDGANRSSATTLRVVVYADEIEPLHGSIPVMDALDKWVCIATSSSPRRGDHGELESLPATCQGLGTGKESDTSLASPGDR
jgi:hypothetical protein